MSQEQLCERCRVRRVSNVDLAVRNPYEKIVHRAGKMNDAGEVSALCYKTPHPIDLARACYTIYGTPTCPKCVKILATRRATEATASATLDEDDGTEGAHTASRRTT